MNSIKCPGCGLVNFSTAAECKRCHLSFESDQAAFDGQPHNHWPQAAAEQQQRPVFTGVVMFVTGVLIVGMIIMMLQQALHPFDPDTAKGIGALVVIIGALFMLLTKIVLLVRIFEESLGWGLASLFIPFAILVAIAHFWEKTRRSVVGHMVAWGVVFVGVGIGL
jgi:hypothetical protein